MAGNADPARPEPAAAEHVPAPVDRRRLSTLHDFRILDTPAEAAFDEITALAARLCLAPMASISLVDADRQWLKSEVGGLATESPLEESFCAHALGDQAMLVVPDATQDPRFRANPLVTGGQHVRFYAGAPLVAPDGVVLGTLCVLDSVPRTLTPTQAGDLTMLARQVVSQLEVRRNARALAEELQGRLDAEVELRHSQEVLAGILEHSDVLVYAKDLHGRYILANSALEQTLAVPGGLTGRRDTDLFPAAAAAAYRENDRRTVVRGGREVFEETLTRQDGSVHQYRSTKFPLRGHDGEVYAIAGVSTDVTALTAAQAAVTESEQRWRALVEHSPVAVAVIDADGLFAYANPQADRLYGGADPAHIAGLPANRFVGPADLQDISVKFGSVLTGGLTLLNHRWQLLQLDGGELTVEINAAAVSYRSRPAVQVELRDISAKVAAEKRLSESERRFRTVFTGSPIAMAISDERGLWVDANAAMGHLIGVDPPELIGRSVQEYTHPDDRAALADADIAQQHSSDGVYRLEVRLLPPDGTTRWAWVSITPTPGPDGQRWTLAIAQDITARKAAETALHQSESELAAIAAVARCVQAGQDPRPIVVDSVRQLADAAAVALVEQLDPQSLTVTAAAGVDTIGVSILLQETSMTAHVWRTGRPVFLADAALSPLVNPALLALDNTVSALWQPIIVADTVQAILNVTWQHRVDDPGDRAVRAVRLIADETAVSLHAKNLRQELEHSARTDPLTGLINRRAWDADLREAISRTSAAGTPLIVALIDLDHFKAYNDTHGHNAGDTLLRQFATTARASLRSADVLARWGGEEFILALPDTTAPQAVRILTRLRGCVPDGQTCSVGYTQHQPAETPATTIARADTALYRAKAAGRDRARIA